MQPDRNTCILFLILVIVGQNDLGPWEVFDFTLGAVRTHVRDVHPLVAKHEISDVVELGKVRDLLIVY